MGKNSDNDKVVDFLNELLLKAVMVNASDLHLQKTADLIQVAFRIDGVLKVQGAIPETVSERLFGRIKYLAKMKTYQDNYPQDGRINGQDIGLNSDIRVSSYPTIGGEKILLRFFRKSLIKNINELGYPESIKKQLLKFLSQRSGMLLLTGPAGSGKTTTIYACLLELAKEADRNIISIEDPVEHEIPGIMQTQINEAIDLTFPNALRHLLRQDPEVIIIGEIRDELTAKMALRTAFTGHLVIATLHAGSCRGVIERLFDMCDDHYAVLSSISLIINQRLIRKKCQDCDGEHCEKCSGTTYHNRIPVADALKIDDEVSQQIRHEGPEFIQDNLKAKADDLLKQDLTDQHEIKRMIG